MISQQEAIAKFIEDTRPSFNQVFFERNEDDIITELMNVIRSCERDNEFFKIKVNSYRVVDDYDEINQILYDYYENLTKNKSKSKKRDNQYGCININESAIRLLIVRYYIADRTDEDYLDVIIAIPRIVDKYYFKINGIMRSTLFQVVDGSTYNNGTSNAKVPSITLKIVFMATRVTRFYSPLELTNGDVKSVTYYFARIFNKSIPAAKYILAKFGFYGMLDFMKLNGSISITRQDPNNPNMYTFKTGAENIFVNTPKELMDNNPLLESVVATIVNSILPGISYECIFDTTFWIRSLGLEFSGGGNERLIGIYEGDESVTDTLEKGYNILDSFESIYDVSTKNSIRLPEEDKATTYHVIRWIMREFNALRAKSNLDISYKKIRFAEYIAALYAFKIARGIYRVSDMNKRASIISIRKAIRTDPNYLLMAISKSGMVVYRDMVTDMDSLQALKFTYKGVSGLGEGSNKSIPDIYRSIHPSHVGKVDLDASSDSNPGITGTLCPYAPIYDGFFEDYQEPNSWEQEFLATMEEYKKATGLVEAIEFEEKVLGVDKTEEKVIASEILATMQQIIKPKIFSDQGELIDNLEVDIDGN